MPDALDLLDEQVHGLGGVLTSLAAARKRLPLDVDYPIERDKDLRRYRVAIELLLGAVDRARAAGLLQGELRPKLSPPATGP